MARNPTPDIVHSPSAESNGHSGASTRTTRSRSRVAEVVQSPTISTVDESRGESSQSPSRRDEEHHPSSTSGTPSLTHANIPSSPIIVAADLKDTPDERDEEAVELEVIHSATSPTQDESRTIVNEQQETVASNNISEQDDLPRAVPSSEYILSRDKMEEDEIVGQLKTLLPPVSTIVETPAQENSATDNATVDESSLSKMDVDVDVLALPQLIGATKSPVHEVKVELSDSLAQNRARSESEEFIEDVSMEFDSDDVILPENSPPVIPEKDSVSIPTKPYIPIHIPLPPSTEEKIVIPGPVAAPEEVQYNLDYDLDSDPFHPLPESSVEDDPHVNPQYPLPPLSVLPADFIRKAKPIRRKKEKDSKRDKERDDAMPLGLARWGATANTNPLYKRVARATKCLSTKEWAVGLLNYSVNNS